MDLEKIYDSLREIDRKVTEGNSALKVYIATNDAKVAILEKGVANLNHEMYDPTKDGMGLKADNIRHNDQESSRKWMTRTALAASVAIVAERLVQFFKGGPHP